MKARGMRTAVVVVAAMMISSALMAAPNAHSNNCGVVSSTDGTVWGGGGSGPLKASSSPTTCAPTQITLSTQTHNENDHGFAYAFGKMLAGLRTSLEGTVWGGGGGYIPPK